MPCNLPMVNRRVTIQTKIPLTDKGILASALYELSKQVRGFIYEETTDGYRIQTELGIINLVWDGERYVARAAVTVQAGKILEPVLSMYQAMIVEEIYAEEGYMTERVLDQDNVVQLTAWRG